MIPGRSTKSQVRLTTRKEIDYWSDHPGWKEGTVIDRNALLRYLRNCGVILPDNERLGDNIVVDLSWACEVLYSHLRQDPESRALFAEHHGQFTPATLLQVWQLAGKTMVGDDLTQALDLLLAHGVCFRLSPDISDAVYLAPEHLSRELATPHLTRWRTWPTRYGWRLEYDFLAESELRQFLADAGHELRSRAAYFRWGLYLTSGSNWDLLLKCELGLGPNHTGGQITVQVGSAEALTAEAQILLEQLGRRVLRSCRPRRICRITPTGEHELPANQWDSVADPSVNLSWGLNQENNQTPPTLALLSANLQKLTEVAPAFSKASPA